MQVNIHLFGSLRDYLPREQRGRTTVEVETASTIHDVLHSLGIEKPVLFAVNEAHDNDSTYQLQAGDTLTVFELTAGG
ncbi:MAG: MoaD/ThiS family protein [Anaerolineae bacterium]|nr:MoaD/ThiS family protein [Anaerolineae bacterium]MDQ7037501.1 MoaD/ThiS family protein [Anaerolineae bacterium]